MRLKYLGIHHDRRAFNKATSSRVYFLMIDQFTIANAGGDVWYLTVSFVDYPCVYIPQGFEFSVGNYGQANLNSLGETDVVSFMNILEGIGATIQGFQREGVQFFVVAR